MPGYDGTGPRGEGPLTGRGEGYCAIRLPDPGSDQEAVGFAGLAGTPVRIVSRVTHPTVTVWPRMWNPWRPLRRGRGRRAGPRRGMRFFMRRW